MSGVLINNYTRSVTAQSGEPFDLSIWVTTMGIKNLKICAEFIVPDGSEEPIPCKFIDPDCESRSLLADLNNKELKISLTIECPCEVENDEYGLHVNIIVSDADDEKTSDNKIPRVIITC